MFNKTFWAKKRWDIAVVLLLQRQKRKKQNIIASRRLFSQNDAEPEPWDYTPLDHISFIRVLVNIFTEY